LIVGYSPFKSAYYSIIALMVVYTLSKLVSDKKLGFEIVRKTGSSLKKGAFDTVPIATACASAGIIAGILSITGLGSKLSGLIVQLSDGRLIVALVLTMLVSLLLGMGLPTTAAYLVLASVVAPALVQLGLPLLSAHMFVFFFGCISTITPPVALASYVAAGIAGTDLNKVGWKAFQYGLVSFILPYMFVYGPSLFMIGSIQLIIMTFLFSALGVFGIAVSIVGFYKVELQQWQRIILFIAGLLMVSHGILTDIIGISLYILIYTTTTRKLKKSKAITEI
jgi:TRAP transporter 4TM/12TM fusion protein